MTTTELAKVEDILHLHLPPEKVTQIMREIYASFNVRTGGSRPGYKGSVVTKPTERSDDIDWVINKLNFNHNAN